MKTIKKKLTINAFFDGSGVPTCASNFNHPDGVCKFLRLKKMGTIETCIFTGKDLERNGEYGHFIISEGCPIWGNDER